MSDEGAYPAPEHMGRMELMREVYRLREALEAIRVYAGFAQQGQRRANVFPESSRTANHDEPH